MPKNNPPEKKARVLQAESGRPYRACLQEVLDAQAEREPSPAPVAEFEQDDPPDFGPPTSSGLFSHA